MKIAVASNDGIHVTGHLGRARQFIVYTVEERKVVDREFRDNTFTNHGRSGHQHHGEHDHHHDHDHDHGHGHQHHGEGGHSHNGLINGLRDCEVILFTSGGWRVVEDLKAAQIYPFMTNEPVADVAIEKYLEGTLDEAAGNTCHAH